MCSDDSVEAGVAGVKSTGDEVIEGTLGRSQSLLDHPKGCHPTSGGSLGGL